MDKKWDMVFDLDDTIISGGRTIMNLYNHIYGTNHQVDYKNLQWDFRPYLKTEEETQKALDLFLHEDFYNPKFLVVFDNIIDIINTLTNMGNKIAICSKQHPLRRPHTLKWVKKTMPKVEVLFSDDFHNKNEVISSCRIFYDDRIEALDGMKDCADLCVCVGNYNWNKEWTGARQDSEKWYEIKIIIDLYKFLKG